MKKDFRNYGEVVKSLRKNRGFTQAQLADKIGVHSQFLSNAERAMCNLPKEPMKRFTKVLALSELERLQILNAIIKDECAKARASWSKPLGLKL